jgi:hypothetical protein
MSVRLPLAFLLGVAAAVLVACGGGGGSSDNLLSQSRADRIKGDLTDIRQAVNEQACDAAQAGLNKLKEDLDGMPSSVDARLRERLREGYAKLSQRVPVDCTQATTTTTTVPTTTTTTPTTTETTPTTPTTTETTPTATTPPTTTTPPDTTTTDGGSGSGGVTAP